MHIPNMMLKNLYTVGSLKNTGAGAQFALKNRFTDAELVGVRSIAIDGTPLPLDQVRLALDDHRVLSLTDLDAAHPVPFPVRSTVTVQTNGANLGNGTHKIEISFESRPFGDLRLKVEDAITEPAAPATRIPRDEEDDYSPEIVGRRRAYVEQTTGVNFHHTSQYSFDPHTVKGNCENFVGIAQVPMGLAGPLRVNGEHAVGDFLIPMATSEGTMIASYNRGMKALTLCGGVKVTVMADAMQRAPVFVLRDARVARDFIDWIGANVPLIREKAQATSSVAKLLYIDPYVSNKFVYLRFNFSTGDAAGQNMVGRATYAACEWILSHFAGIESFCLEGNFATDKKASHVNLMRTRGKRVTAEAVLTRQVMTELLRTEPEGLAYYYGVANVGAFLSGANNNGLQSANGITAIFIATGQDVANVAESSAGIFYLDMTPEGGLYISLTIPALILATYGGGTSLATQRECLEMLGCYGTGKVNHLAEIVCGAALAGEISLACAIAASDWVTSHEKFGRNR